MPQALLRPSLTHALNRRGLKLLCYPPYPGKNRRMHLESINTGIPETLRHAPSIGSWLQQHLFSIGSDHLKLQAYQKLSPLIFQGGGGVIKNTVFEISLFVKKEWTENSSLTRHIPFSLSLGNSKPIPEKKLFYVSLGYMLLAEKENHIDPLIDEVFELFLVKGGSQIAIDRQPDILERKVCKITRRYFNMVSIDYQKLYRPTVGPRFITIGDDFRPIELPPLPQIKSKQSLAKALLHKEMYHAFLDSRHFFHKTMSAEGLEVTPSVLKIVRYELLFFDGLGDLFLAKESSKYLYKLRQRHPFSDDDSFGKKTYYLLKTILATNTFLLKLAIAYNLHSSLEDQIVSNMLQTSYASSILATSDSEEDPFVRYEEEFIADYFEQYVGALYLEQPEVAKKWIDDLFEQVLSLITESYKIRSRKRRASHQYNYRAWSVDVIGRSV